MIFLTHRRNGIPLLAAIAIAFSSMSPVYADAGHGHDTDKTAKTQNTAQSLPEILVYKSPNCGCCTKWVKHLRQSGFQVKAENTDKLDSIKKMSGIEPHLASCHTALVDGYVIEGHVPADDIKRLLQERPAIKGLSVPGMPMGSPGMEGPRQDAYQVLSFDTQGKTAVFANH